MALYIRMALYAIFAGLAGMGYGELSPDGARFSVSIDALAEILVGAIGFAGTFAVSRIAARRGGKT